MGALNVNNYQSTLQEYTTFINQKLIEAEVQNQCIASNVQNIQAYFGAIPQPRTQTAVQCDFSLTNGTITARQNATTTCRLDSISQTNVNQTIDNVVQNTIDEFLQQQQQTRQGWLTLALAANINNINTVAQLSTQIKESFTVENSAICSATAANFQNQALVFCGVYENVTLDLGQTSVLQAYTSCAADAMVKSWESNSTLNQIAVRAFQSQRIDQQGLFGGLAILAAVIGLILLIGLVLYFVFSGSGGKKEGEAEGGESKETQQLLMELEAEGE